MPKRKAQESLEIDTKWRYTVRFSKREHHVTFNSSHGWCAFNEHGEKYVPETSVIKYRYDTGVSQAGAKCNGGYPDQISDQLYLSHPDNENDSAAVDSIAEVATAEVDTASSAFKKCYFPYPPPTWITDEYVISKRGRKRGAGKPIHRNDDATFTKAETPETLIQLVDNYTLFETDYIIKCRRCTRPKCSFIIVQKLLY